MSLKINNLHVSTDKKDILHGVSLDIPKGEIHVLMGPNGSGKSTLANTLMGHPKYEITEGAIMLDDTEITDISPDKRAKAGFFLSLQHPTEIHGVSVNRFLRAAVEAQTGEKQQPLLFYKKLVAVLKELGMDPEFAKREVHVGMSGGEKKRLEMLQLTMLDPTYAILDETDSGLDVDALRAVSAGINAYHTENNGILLITHYQRILDYVIPDVVHIMIDGKIVKSGGKELVREIEENGYAEYTQKEK